LAGGKAAIYTSVLNIIVDKVRTLLLFKWI